MSGATDKAASAKRSAQPGHEVECDGTDCRCDVHFIDGWMARELAAGRVPDYGGVDVGMGGLPPIRVQSAPFESSIIVALRNEAKPLPGVIRRRVIGALRRAAYWLGRNHRR